MSTLALDAEALYGELLRGVRGLLQPPHACWSASASGGAWLAERLQRTWGCPARPASSRQPLHRDDFARAAWPSAPTQTELPFDVNGAHILLLDDVLYTGRTIRAVINELFDFGRPASVQLAVLVDRGGRELPVAGRPTRRRALTLPAQHQLALARDDGGRFGFTVKASD